MSFVDKWKFEQGGCKSESRWKSNQAEMDAETSGGFCGLLLIPNPIPSLSRLHVATIRIPDNLLPSFSTMRIYHPAKRNPTLNFEDSDPIG